MSRSRGAAKVQVCGGFDGSDTADWTAIRLERLDGYQFTPTYGPAGSKVPTFWDPVEHGGHIPRLQVATAVEEIFATYDVERFYCDPFDWKTEIEGWALKYGENHVFQWDTGRGNTRVTAVFYALERFLTDVKTGALASDECLSTTVHMRNARKIPKPGEKYTIGKPANEAQKIDLAMTSVLCHEAACDARAAGWKVPTRSLVVVRG